MKRIKQILPIIIAFIIGISTTVGAVTVFNSKDITYSSSATSKKNVKEALDELYTKSENSEKCPNGKLCLENEVWNIPIGSYVNMTPTSTSYTISNNLTGYTSDQTINPSKLNLWRVIKINGNGTVEMVSDRVSDEYVYFSGKEGYINLVNGLNTIAAQYTNSDYTIMARHIGYSHQIERIMDTSKLSQTTVPWKKDTSIYDEWTGCNMSSYLCGADENLGAGDIGYEEDYNLVKGVYGTMEANDDYWLASRSFSYAGDRAWLFNGRYVHAGNLGKVFLYKYDYQSGFESVYKSYALRPIVLLKPEIKIVGGNGTSSSPYNLSID